MIWYVVEFVVKSGVHAAYQVCAPQRKRKLRRGDKTTSMDEGNGDVAVGQQSTHATRQIRTRNPKESGLTTGH